MAMSVLLVVKVHLQHAYAVTAAKVDEWRSKKVKYASL